jgi:hypothetical protein
LLDDIALSRRHVVLEHVEVLARLALALLLVDTDVIISSPPADLDRLSRSATNWRKNEDPAADRVRP